MSVAELEARMRGWLAAGYRAVVFEIDSQPVAYGLFRLNEGGIHLRQFFVARAFRRQGIGRRAIEAFRQRFAPPGALTLEVLVHNSPGLAFWRALGFQEHALSLRLLPSAAADGRRADYRADWQEKRRVSFCSQPTLNGTLVELRPLRPEDYGDLYAVAADPLIWEQHPAKNRHEENVFREFFAEALASGGALLATDTESRQVIGTSRYSEDKGEVEIGWTFLARSHWGGRYNGELKQLMLRQDRRRAGTRV